MPGKRMPRKAPEVATSDSPFFDFLENDRVPSVIERDTIKELLAEKIAHLAHLNSRVPKRRTGKKTPRQLRADLNHTRRFIKFHQALIAPWRRLPVEIMGEVFLFTLEITNHDDGQDDYWNDDRSSTLLLCRICRTWRDIAISTPALWNVLSLTLDFAMRPLDWISEWLDRSRSFPVYLQVFWGNRALPDVINPVISVFAAHIHHAAGLWIDGMDIEDPELVRPPYPVGTFPTPQSLHAPLLTTIGADLPPGSTWDWIRTACQASPGLTRLTTSELSLDWFPITNLTKLHFIEPVPMSDLFRVLEHAPSLQDISFDVDGPSATRSTGKALVMGAVSRLEITSTEYLGPFLDQIELPRLGEVGIHQITNWPQLQFCSFLSRSSCVLGVLDFYDVRITEGDIIACLQHKACNTLQGLVVSECLSPMDALLQHLTYRQHPFPNPYLVAIELGSTHSRDGTLSDLAESRVAPPTGELPSGVAEPARLRKFRFSFIEGSPVAREVSHKSDYERLRKLEDAYPELDLVWPE